MGGLVPLESLVGSNFGVGMSGEKTWLGIKTRLGFWPAQTIPIGWKRRLSTTVHNFHFIFILLYTLLPVYVQALLLWFTSLFGSSIRALPILIRHFHFWLVWWTNFYLKHMTRAKSCFSWQHNVWFNQFPPLLYYHIFHSSSGSFSTPLCPQRNASIIISCNFIFSLVYALVCVNRGRNMKGSLMNDDTNSCNISMRVRLSEIKHFGSSSIQSQWVAYKLDRKSSLLMLRENSFLTSLYSQRLHIFLTTTGRTSAACWDWREKVFGVCRLI